MSRIVYKIAKMDYNEAEAIAYLKWCQENGTDIPLVKVYLDDSLIDEAQLDDIFNGYYK